MSSKKIITWNRFSGNAEPLPTLDDVFSTTCDNVALPPELPADQAVVTTKIKKSGYRQQSVASIHEQVDGEIQQKQKTQLEMIHVSHEKHSDGTEETKVQRNPTKVTVVERTGQSQSALDLIQQVSQQNTLVPIPENPHQQNALPSPTENPEQVEVIVKVSRSQKPKKSLVAESREITEHAEKKVLLETFTKLSPQQSIQYVPPVPSLQQPTDAIVPITNTEVITWQPQQPMPGKAAIICKQKQGIDEQQEIETIGTTANTGEYSIHQVDNYREEQTMKTIRETVSTSDGIYEHVQIVAERVVIREAIRQLYIDASEDDTPEGSNAVDPSPFERCIDIFCQAFTCKCDNPFKHQTEMVAKQDIMSPILRRGRAKGLNLLKQLTFPFVLPGWRIVWIVFELILVIVSTVLSITSYVKGSQNVFNLVHLVLASISTVLALIDGCYSLPNSWKLWREHLKKKREEQKREEGQEQERRQKKAELEEEQPLLQPTSEDSTGCCKCRWCNNPCCNCI